MYWFDRKMHFRHESRHFTTNLLKNKGKHAMILTRWVYCPMRIMQYIEGMMKICIWLGRGFVWKVFHSKNKHWLSYCSSYIKFVGFLKYDGLQAILCHTPVVERMALQVELFWLWLCASYLLQEHTECDMQKWGGSYQIHHYNQI